MCTALRGELLRIATQCDGVRCDMAMLVLPDVFERTWHQKTAENFWATTISAVRKTSAHFTMLAECYWDMEWRLMELGFSYCYDKRLLDRLESDDAQGVRAHLCADVDAFQRKLARFLENHDEKRAATAFADVRKHQAAAWITYLTPGCASTALSCLTMSLSL
jgi:hypothetical protein